MSVRWANTLVTQDRTLTFYIWITIISARSIEYGIQWGRVPGMPIRQSPGHRRGKSIGGKPADESLRSRDPTKLRLWRVGHCQASNADGASLDCSRRISQATKQGMCGEMSRILYLFRDSLTPQRETESERSCAWIEQPRNALRCVTAN